MKIGHHALGKEDTLKMQIMVEVSLQHFKAYFLRIKERPFAVCEKIDNINHKNRFLTESCQMLKAYYHNIVQCNFTREDMYYGWTEVYHIKPVFKCQFLGACSFLAVCKYF